MSLLPQTELAKEGAKVVVTLMVAVAFGALVWWGVHAAKTHFDEYYRLQVVEREAANRQRVSDAGTAAAVAARAARQEEQAQHVEIVVRQDEAKQEARREDPSVDDWLHQPIPRRLRDADAAARRSGRLGENREREQ